MAAMTSSFHTGKYYAAT